MGKQDRAFSEMSIEKDGGDPEAKEMSLGSIPASENSVSVPYPGTFVVFFFFFSPQCTASHILGGSKSEMKSRI